MNIRKRYILIPFIVALCFCLFLLMDTPNTSSKSLQTQGVIRDVYSELLRMDNNEKSDLRKLLQSKGEAGCLSRLLCDLMKNAWVKYSQSNLDLFENNCIIDAWGNPLCMAWRSDIMAKSSIDLLNSVDYELLIWSSGKNGIDEFGHNDDIVYEMSEVVKQANKTNW